MKMCPTCRLVSPDTAKVCDCGYDFETGLSLTKKESIKKPVIKVLGWIAGLIAFALGRSAPIPFLMAFGGIWLAALISKRLNSAAKPMHAAFIVQAGLFFALIGAMLAAVSLGKEVSTLLPDLVVLMAGLIWLVTRPGTWPVVVLTLFQSISIIGNVYNLLSAPEVASEFISTGILSVVLRAASIWFMISGLREMRKLPVPLAPITR